MRLSVPTRSVSACAAATSITSSAAPGAFTVPATRTLCRRRPVCTCSRSRAAPSRASASRAAGLRNTASGAKMSSRRAAPPSSWRASTGMSAGEIRATTKASTPTIFTGSLRSPGSSTAVGHSSTGLASATSGCAATRSSKASSSAPWRARSSRSGWPLTALTALENSASAEALISCTANASATPSITATTAEAVRHGWWRSSCNEKVVSSARMGLSLPPARCDCQGMRRRSDWCGIAPKPEGRARKILSLSTGAHRPPGAQRRCRAAPAAPTPFLR